MQADDRKQGINKAWPYGKEYYKCQLNKCQVYVMHARHCSARLCSIQDV